LLDDPDADVRRTAARALGLVGCPSVVPALLAKLDSPRPVSLNTVTMAVIRIGTDAVPALLEGIRSADARARAVSAELLGIGGSVAALQPLADALRGDESLEVRIRAARALGRIGAPASLDVLAEALRSDQPVPLRAVAAKAAGEFPGARTVTVLRRALDAPEHVVAANAARALAKLGEPGLAVLQHAAIGKSTPRAMHAREALSYAAQLTPVSAR
jgi:HEAT repeat protein